MRHCCSFDADEVYYLEDNTLYSERILLTGYCPICYKLVAELVEKRFDDVLVKTKKSGINAEDFIAELKKQVVYRKSDVNYLKFKPKPFGWKYGENKVCKSNGKTYIKQYAKDFYGNIDLVKITPY